MSNMKFCANLNFLFCENNSNILDKFRLASKAGFKGVEISYPSDDELDKLLTTQKECNLNTVLMNICLKGSENVKFGPTSVPGEEDQFKSNLRETVELAKKMNCGKIHLMSGKMTSKPRSEHLKTYINNLKFASKLLEENNIIGLIEPINKYSVPNYFLDNYETAIEVLKEVNSSNVKLMVDVFHLQHIQGNVTNTFKDLSGFIGHVQIAQVPHRHEPDVPGELDFSYVFQAMKDSGYDDWVGCEYKPKTDTLTGLKWISQHEKL